jgi:AcrR family transcriptional regulator
MTTRRRDAGRPRGAPIERAILTATLDALAEHGIEGLSIPQIAAACDVHKTTIYRRWPTREALVDAALDGVLHDTAAELRDTGSLAGDLRALVEAVHARVASVTGRALLRAAMFSGEGGARIAQSPAPAGIVALVERAAARGEWDVAAGPPDVVLALLSGALMHRVLLERQPVTPEWMDAMVGVVVQGVRGHLR